MSQITGWSLSDFKRMKLDELRYWVEECREFQKDKKKAMKEFQRQQRGSQPQNRRR